MNIVYFGTDVFLSTFQFMLSKHRILALYTYHKDEDYLTEGEIVKLAGEHAVPVYYENITEERMKEYRREGADLFYVAEYDRRLPVPEDPGLRAVNTHSSLLPEGRGYYPIEVAMYHGLKRTGVTLHKIVPEFDRGDILLQEAFSIEPADDSVDIYHKCADTALHMVGKLLADFNNCWNGARPQTEVLPYWKRPPEETMRITHEMTVSEAAGIYRCFNKMTKVEIDGRLFYVNSFATGNRVVRAILRVSGHSVLFGLKDGHIRIGIEPV